MIIVKKIIYNNEEIIKVKCEQRDKFFIKTELNKLEIKFILYPPLANDFFKIQK